MKEQIKNIIEVIGVILLLVGVLLFIGWFHTRPCNELGWVPVKSLPSRCLNLNP